MTGFIIFGILILGGSGFAIYRNVFAKRADRDAVGALNACFLKLSTEFGLQATFVAPGLRSLSESLPVARGNPDRMPAVLRCMPDEESKIGRFITEYKLQVAAKKGLRICIRPRMFFEPRGESAGPDFDTWIHAEVLPPSMEAYLLSPDIRQQLSGVASSRVADFIIDLDGSTLSCRIQGLPSLQPVSDTLRILVNVVREMALKLEETGWDDGKPVAFWS